MFSSREMREILDERSELGFQFFVPMFRALACEFKEVR